MPILRKKLAIVIGCGSFGGVLACTLADAGYLTRVVDINQGAFADLGDDFDGETVAGDGTNVSVLEDCDIDRASLLVAATHNDPANALIAETASEIFGVERVYARIEDDSLLKMLADTNIGLICPHLICINEFYRLSGIKPAERRMS